MMLELSMHILDIVENSTQAGARLVTITVTEDIGKDIYSIEISDDGEGMDKETLAKALDPFYSTKSVRRIGLGVPMLCHATECTEGSFTIESKKGGGTRIMAVFKHSHIDRQPLGNIAGTLITLIAGYPQTDFAYSHTRNDQNYTLDTRKIKQLLEDIPINTSEVIQVIRKDIQEGLEEIGVD